MPSYLHLFLVSLIISQAPIAALGADGERSSADGKHISNLSTTVAGAAHAPEVLKGSASVERSVWQKHYDSGVKALDLRQFQVAQRKLQLAFNELRRIGANDRRLALTRLGMAEAFLGLDNYQDAGRLFADAATRFKSERSLETAKSLLGWAQCETALGHFRKAQQLAKESIQTAESVAGPKHPLVGKGNIALGQALAAEGLDEDAIQHLRAAVELLEHGSSQHELDLAEAEYELGMLLQSQGHRTEAPRLIERALATKDKYVVFNDSAKYKGLVKYRWEEGSPRARQIHDPDYPLKYINVGGVRVATTIVRSENVIAALISLSNCTKQRIEVGTGPVALEQLRPSHKNFRQVHHTELDIVLETQHVSNLTWRRRWLNHIQKTRNIPGYLKDGVLDNDNFFGPNAFSSIYGSWSTLARPATPIVTREQFLHSPYFSGEKHPAPADFLAGTAVNLQTTYIDPGESKTGLVFFQRERFDAAKLKMIVGNAQVEFPFASAGPR